MQTSNRPNSYSRLLLLAESLKGSIIFNGLIAKVMAFIRKELGYIGEISILTQCLLVLVDTEIQVILISVFCLPKLYIFANLSLTIVPLTLALVMCILALRGHYLLLSFVKDVGNKLSLISFV